MRQHRTQFEVLEERLALTAHCRDGLSIGEDGGLLADIDLDGEVAFGDFLVLSRNFGQKSDLAGGDLNGNGSVDFGDYLLLSQGFRIADKPRLIVLTDIGGDPDDQQSMVRLMTYSNEFSIESLVAGAHLAEGANSSAHLIHEIIDAYDEVRDNLLLHDADYPTADRLRAAVVTGQESLGRFGPGNDTAGSTCIIQAVDARDSRPVNIAIWGGATDLAQALVTVRDTRTPAEVDEFVSKIRVSWIEQDPSVAWIKSTFPKLRGVSHSVSGNGFVDSPFRGMYLGGDETLTTATWVRENVNEHAPLGTVYPTTAAGAEMKEGDTPTWFYFLPTALGDPDHPEWGGWGGRFEPSETSGLASPAQDEVDGITNGRNTVNRWRADFQNDFAARMDWTTHSLEAANHPPFAVIDSRPELTVDAGERVTISAARSRDRDGDNLAFDWFQYNEAGTYPADVILRNADSSTVSFVAPFVTEPQTLHIVLRLSDDGGPSLVDYRRVVVTVTPANLEDAIRILPIGDSFVQPEYLFADSDRRNPGFRFPLQRMLSEEGIQHDFIGSQNVYCGASPDDFPSPVFDPDHEGHWGWRTEEFLNGPRGSYCGGDAGSGSLADWIGGYEAEPDVVLIQVGINDVIQFLAKQNTPGITDLSADEVFSVAQNINEMVNVLHDNLSNPDLRVFVATLSPLEGANEEVRAVNAALRTFAAVSPRYDLVDMFDGFDTDQHSFDGLHPNTEGELLIADRWFDAIVSELP